MGIEVKKLKHISDRHQKIFDTGLKAAEQSNFPYAIVMFRNLLKEEPGLLEVREKLRKLQFERMGNEVNKFRQTIAPLVALPNIFKANGLIKSEKFAEALDNAEGAMKFDPTTLICCNLLTSAANAAGLDAITMQTIELIEKFHPDNAALLSTLADAYSRLGRSKDAVACYEKIVKKNPSNGKYKQELQQAKANMSIDDLEPEDNIVGKNDEKTTKGRKKKGGQLPMDQQELATQIKVQENVVNQSESAETRKKLGDLFAVAKDYEKAMENYNRSAKIAATVDPNLDFAITAVTTAQYEDSISNLEDRYQDSSVSDEDREEVRQQLESLKQELAETVVMRARERQQRNPHSADFQFELAKTLWKYGVYDEAIGHFQQTQNNAELKDFSLLFLGKCYQGKRQHDEAIKILTTLVNSIARMNKTKKNAYYTLAKCYEFERKLREAETCYKEIYAADENYKDVSRKVDAIYKQHKFATV